MKDLFQLYILEFLGNSENIIICIMVKSVNIEKKILFL